MYDFRDHMHKNGNPRIGTMPKTHTMQNKKANILNHKSVGNNLIRTLKAGVSIQPTLSAGRLNFTSTFSQGCRTYFGFFGLFYLYPIIVHH